LGFAGKAQPPAKDGKIKPFSYSERDGDAARHENRYVSGGAPSKRNEDQGDAEIKRRDR